MPLKFLPEYSTYPIPYKIDYHELLKELNAIQVFSEPQLQSEYAQNWIDYLEDIDKSTTDKLKNKDFINYELVKHNERNVIFWHC